ncbi:hypothetical protein A2U01_0052300, partial [Trifolium medium]|nr:hypothetical protein [Trifolium medium]
NHWLIPPLIHELAPWLIDEIRAVILPVSSMDDVVVWKKEKDCVLSTKDAYNHLFPPLVTLHSSCLMYS